jgi:hypothetical protein
VIVAWVEEAKLENLGSSRTESKRTRKHHACKDPYTGGVLIEVVCEAYWC